MLQADAGVPWWQEAVIYHLYVRSFQDTNGDGVGDLKGVERRLDYLEWLGIDTIWLSPFFPSPMADFGYDISDYCNVDPLFGTLADFDRLVRAVHARNIRIVLDFVPNHTSDQHPWFIESRSSRESAKRDWYLWRDPACDGGPPNNWISDFGGPAWSFDQKTGQYYYHAFLPQQPDLNWRNPEVRAAMHEVLRFWLDRGVDGFRVDVAWHLIKDAAFTDNPLNPHYQPHMGEMHRVLQIHSTDQPEVFETLAELRRVLDEYDERVMIAEIYLPLERLVAYYGERLHIAHLPFNFHLIETPWTAGAIGALIAEYEHLLPSGGWPTWVLGNHDRPRIATRVGHDGARLAAMLLLTLRGTPTLYYGDEIGLADGIIPPGGARDPRELRQPGIGLSRDPVRTPMHWDDTGNAGFTAGDPWLPLQNVTANVEALKHDRSSILCLYKELLALRRARPALRDGSIRLLPTHPDLLGYERQDVDERVRVFLNLSNTAQELPLGGPSRLLLSTHRIATDDCFAKLDLAPIEGVILEA